MKTKILTLTLCMGLLSGLFSCNNTPDVVPSDEADITSFTLAEETGPSIIDGSGAAVHAEVQNGTDRSDLSPTITFSEGAGFSPNFTLPSDYTNPVTIPVEAEDGSIKNWTINVSEEPPPQSTDTDILNFTLPQETGAASIDDTDHTVGIEVENGTDLADLTPTFALSAGATSLPASETAGDYSSEVTITVTAEDGTTTQAWKVNVTEAPPPPNDGTDILAFFIIPEQTSLATIDWVNHTVAIEVVNGTNRINLTPKFLVSIGASSVPASETAGNYINAVTIRVLAEDEITFQDWTVHVIEAPVGISSETDILTFSVPDQTRAPLIDGENHRITYAVEADVDRRTLTPTFTLSPGATSVPASETTGNYTDLVTITVTAEDGATTQDWTADVYHVEDFDPSIFCDENLCTNDDALQQECQDFLIDCLLTQSGKDYDECLISALLICKK